MYETTEVPVADVLAKMEITRLKTDANILIQLESDFAQRPTEPEADIYLEAGERFSINSPKQLDQILFEKLGFPPIRRTKAGYSTSVETLEQLRGQPPIVQKVLDYRQIAKI